MTNLEVVNKFIELYGDLFAHDGFGDIRIEVRILRRGQKEVIIHCGKQYRYVIDVEGEQLLLSRMGSAVRSIDGNSVEQVATR